MFEHLVSFKGEWSVRAYLEKSDTIMADAIFTVAAPGSGKNDARN